MLSCLYCKPDISAAILVITGLFLLIYGMIEVGKESWTDRQVMIAPGVSNVLPTRVKSAGEGSIPTPAAERTDES